MNTYTEGLSLRDVLAKIVESYPVALLDRSRRDLPRIEYNIRLVLDRLGPDISICDVGGGIGYFSVGCAALGLRATLIDDFGDPVNRENDSALDLHQRYGVTVMKRDVIREGLGLPAHSLDAVTTFDSMEHWHASPKSLFREVRSVLRPGGLFVLGVPNCVNLRKRVAVPIGKGKWSSMEDWYEQPEFRGHVREPDVEDLLYIARDMRLDRPQVLGRNFLGQYSDSSVVRAATRLTDPILRLRPSLCSDLYLLGYA